MGVGNFFLNTAAYAAPLVLGKLGQKVGPGTAAAAEEFGKQIKSVAQGYTNGIDAYKIVKAREDALQRQNDDGNGANR